MNNERFEKGVRVRREVLGAEYAACLRPSTASVRRRKSSPSATSMRSLESSAVSAMAFVGLGQMGSPMAARLLSAGYRVRLFDITQARVTALAKHANAMATTCIEDAAHGADVLITMLPNGDCVREVLLGADGNARGGALAQLAPGALVIDMSSSAPLGTRALGHRIRLSGHRMVDAPVSGGVKRATDGTLSIMAGGDRKDLEASRPILRVMGEKIFHAGPLGSGHAMKALNNYVSAAGLVAAFEALLIGRSFGLDPAVMTEILNASTGRNNTTENKVREFVLSNSFASGFALGLMVKDLRTASDLAQGLSKRMPLMQQLSPIWEEAQRCLGDKADHTEMYKFLDQVSLT